MSDTPTPADVAPKNPAQPAQAPRGAEETTDWEARFNETVAESRKWEARAKENKAAADELAQIREASKSEAEKAAERLAAAEREAAEAKAAVLRRDIALEHSLSREDAALLDAVVDEDAMRTLAARLAAGQQVDDKTPRTPKPDPNQGRQANGTRSTADVFGAWAESQFTR